MPKFLAAPPVMVVMLRLVVVLMSSVVPVRAQEPSRWNTPRARALVERATRRRAEQLADTALADYTATAHGYLTFLAQLGEGLREPPKVVKADELALEVYWRAPNLSKQIVVGRRDTLLLPTDIQYHRDHLGVVQNNFPSIIRVGDGDEVRDVPHPLSSAGLGEYDFAIRDSVKIRLPGKTLDVYEVRVRPKNERAARIIGAVFIDTTSAEVVRMAFDFTRGALIDRELEDVSIVLENALVQGRFWLPSRQEVEIRRGGTWLDYPARGIIRGRWEIGNYKINVGLAPSIFGGEEIAFADAKTLRAHPFAGRVLDSLPPDVRAVTDEDVARVRAEARELVRAQALARTTGASLAAVRISDFARVNRAEGLALGAGGIARMGSGVSVDARGRFGIADHEAKGRVALSRAFASGRSLSAFAERDYRLADDVQERSLVTNSLAAQEYGSDYTEPFDVRAAGLVAELGTAGGAAWRLRAAVERHDSLGVRGTPATGRYARTIAAAPLDGAALGLEAEHPTALSLFGTELRWRARLEAMRVTRGAAPDWARGFLTADVERPIGGARLVTRATLGAVAGSPDVAPQALVYLGGPISAPGYAYHEFASRLGASAHVEWQIGAPFFSLDLGGFGRSPARMTLAPYAHVAYVDGAMPVAARAQGFFPSVGLGSMFLFDLVRFDVARGLRGGRWTFSADVNRAFWSIL
ncbi:MAG: hypothetical protein ABJD07_04280 [Gemmatimonadaceae bacterium]